MRTNKTELSLFNNHNFGLWPHEGLFSDLIDESFWGNFGFIGFKVDVKEKDDAYIINAEMPGMDKDNVNIDISHNVLTICARFDESSEQKNEDGRYIRKERQTGFFHRSFSLDNVKTEQIKAEMKNGVLTLHCPKKENSSSNSKRIDIE